MLRRPSAALKAVHTSTCKGARIPRAYRDPHSPPGMPVFGCGLADVLGARAGLRHPHPIDSDDLGGLRLVCQTPKGPDFRHVRP